MRKTEQPFGRSSSHLAVGPSPCISFTWRADPALTRAVNSLLERELEPLLIARSCRTVTLDHDVARSARARGARARLGLEALTARAAAWQGRVAPRVGIGLAL